MPEIAATQTAADMTYAKPHEFMPRGGQNRRAARMADNFAHALVPVGQFHAAKLNGYYLTPI